MLHLRAQRVQLKVDDVLLRVVAPTFVFCAVLAPWLSARFLRRAGKFARVWYAASPLSLPPALVCDLFALLEHGTALTCAVIPLPAYHQRFVSGVDISLFFDFVFRLLHLSQRGVDDHQVAFGRHGQKLALTFASRAARCWAPLEEN